MGLVMEVRIPRFPIYTDGNGGRWRTSDRSVRIYIPNAP